MRVSFQQLSAVSSRAQFDALFRVALTLVAIGWASAAAIAGAEEEEPKMIENGSEVSVEYTLKLDDGTTADTNVGGKPLTYEQGASQVLPAFEAELEGMKVDETKAFTLSPADGYGEVDPALHREVDPELIPEDSRHVGAQLISEDSAGHRRLVRVHEVSDERLVLDLNHPLAGETLHFDVKVLKIE